MTEDHLLFIQNRSQRAGAQVSLSRLVTQSEITALKPHVILGMEGWLSSFLKKKSIPHNVNPWPSPRSLIARLGGLHNFARKVIKNLTNQGVSIGAIIANDHQESLPALAISKAAGGIPVIAILRTPGMTQADFEKYQCNDCDHLFARGRELTEKARQWSGRNVSCMQGSFSEADLFPPIRSPQAMPTRILVVGSEEPRKGFEDFIQALRIIEDKEPSFPSLDVVLTGEKNESLEHLTRSGFRSQFEFVGRIDDFQNFAKEFQLAIHPSRAETFGMAPFELILAGIPTLLSSTGAASSLPIHAPWIFPTESPKHIADNLIHLWRSWQENLPDMKTLQDSILENYHISLSAVALAEEVRSLT